jgi:hypothetical protein
VVEELRARLDQGVDELIVSLVTSDHPDQDATSLLPVLAEFSND